MSATIKKIKAAFRGVHPKKIDEVIEEYKKLPWNQRAKFNRTIDAIIERQRKAA
jgi:hypothetical protein